MIERMSSFSYAHSGHCPRCLTHHIPLEHKVEIKASQEHGEILWALLYQEGAVRC